MAQQAGSSSVTYRWTYDVFLSFRGEDTRLNFVSHLYESLRLSGIYAFIDDDSLQTGEEITPSLFRAIQESRIAIIVFSKNYASSTFCLDELAKILECFKGEDRWVYPVFYYVDPSVVRHQRGGYGEALDHLQKRFEDKEKLQKWRLALSEAANLSGWHLKPGIAKEQEYIRRITCEVSTKINRTPLHVTNYPVGLLPRVQEVISLLDLYSNEEVKMVGIWGIGGIGKSTITRAVYNLLADQFESLCFLSNVRDISNKHGLTHLQETLLYDLVKEKDLKLGGFYEGISIIAHRLHRKKILLILDDVDESKQLRALAGRSDWFGCGSIVIITTRNKQLLVSHGIKRIYDVKELNDEEALQLFIWNSFKEDNVNSDYIHVLNRAVLYSRGLPLALEVIGSSLCDKRVAEWSSALDEYERIPNKEVFEVLKLSYDALEEMHKEIFLDLACFFNGEKLAVINMLLSFRGVQPTYAIAVLVDKSLIKIQEDCVTMHDLIEDMGKEIVRRQSPKEPGKRNRLWSYEDILHVLEKNTGTNEVEVIILDLPKDKELIWSGKAFMKMENLKVLVIKNAKFFEGPKYLPNSLHVLEWKGYPFELLPSNFHPTKLIHLDLSNSYCEVLQPFTKKFESLSCMNFKNCKSLKEVPDLSGVPNLVELWLDGCTNLIEIHKSVGFLDKLKELSAMRCKSLKTFPPHIKLTSLEHLNLFGCSSLQSFPEILDEMSKMKALDLEGTAIEELPSSVCNLIGLETLNMDECHHLKQLPAGICRLPNLWSLTANFCKEMRYFKMREGGEQANTDCSAMSLKLEHFCFSNCNLSNDSLALLSYFPNMILLDLSFNTFTILPACIKECCHLKYLLLDNCKQLQHIIGMPPNLEKFSATYCTSLTKSSRSRVLNQVFYQQPGKRNFVLPGKKFPEWLDNYSCGNSMPFWVRKEFPSIFLWIIVKDDQDSLCNCKFSVHINDNRLDLPSEWLLLSAIKTDHIYICDLQSIILKAELPRQDKWNRVNFFIENNIKGTKSEREIYLAVHVHRQENNSQNICFMDPNKDLLYYKWQKIQQPQDWEELEVDINQELNPTISVESTNSAKNTMSYQGVDNPAKEVDDGEPNPKRRETVTESEVIVQTKGEVDMLDGWCTYEQKAVGLNPHSRSSDFSISSSDFSLSSPDSSFSSLDLSIGSPGSTTRTEAKLIDRDGRKYMQQEIGRRLSPNKPNLKYIYDVFLSFRGEKTHRSFTTRLYTALKQIGIEVFMDEERIERGENISASLLQAIESSRISIIIFSRNYVCSSWCLQELEKIMECHKTTSQEVFPIFYDVRPFEIRRQQNAFGNRKSWKRLIMRPSTRKGKKLTINLQRTLTEAANLSGWDMQNYRTEVELIEHVIETLTMKLDDNNNLFVALHPVGLNCRVQDIIQSLSSKSNEVIVTGIWGMGGIGKTTIAKAIYNEIGPSFEEKIFLANIREVWKQDNGQVYLLEQLLSSVLKTRMTLLNVEMGKSLIKEILCQRRVLVVLDDMNNEDQLETLCGSFEWFGRGSRIIITTRDERLLKILRAFHVYSVKEMDDNESLEHFSWHAFKQSTPIQDFIELSREVVSYCGGLPLALEILGSYLFDREISTWECVLERLQQIPNHQIHELLKISYDGLSDIEKDIFLDICCFFVGKDRSDVTQILNGCGLQAEIGISRLIERSLVKVDKKNKLDMHDLLRDMGREIIREKSPEEPEKRTRLWFHDDVLHVLGNNIGTIAIKGLALNKSRNNSLSLRTEAFKKMKRLQLLQLDHVLLDGDCGYLSKELRWLCWHGFPLENLPVDLHLEKIVAIDLKYSNLTKMWKESQMLEWLKVLNLSHSHYLTETPNFSKLPYLEKLILKDCPSLSTIHPAIGDLKYIVLINLMDCKGLNHLPRSIYNLKSLKTLNLSSCSKIEKLEEDIEQMESLTTLEATQTAITQVPFSLVRLKSIEYVSLCGYEGLSHDVFPSLVLSWMSPTNHSKSLLRSYGITPSSIKGHPLFARISEILEARPSTSQGSCSKTQELIGFHDQLHSESLETFMSSQSSQVDGLSKVNNMLLKSISQSVPYCQLWLDEPTRRMVAKGYVHNIVGDVIHNVPLPANHLRVSIEIPKEENAILPIPTKEMETVGQAVGSFVAWPTHLIFEAPLLKVKKVQGSRQSKESIAPPSKTLLDPINSVKYQKLLRKFAALALSDNREINVKFDTNIYNKVVFETVNAEFVGYILEHAWLGAVNVNFYIRYLYQTFLVPHDLTRRFIFIHPQDIAVHSIKMHQKAITERTQIVADAFMARADKDVLFLAPYNDVGHWVLVVVNPIEPTIYLLDPLNMEPQSRQQMMKIFNNAVSMLQAEWGLQDNNKGKMEKPLPSSLYEWKSIRFMKDIVTHGQSTIPETYFPDTYYPKYSKTQIEEVIEEWCQYILEHCL